jgi:hypothetical protein
MAVLDRVESAHRFVPRAQVEQFERNFEAQPLSAWQLRLAL